MATVSVLSESEVEQLRQDNYNAQLEDVIIVNQDLRILRIRTDGGTPAFEPGQYTVLGLGYWEPRHEDILDDPHSGKELHKLCKRAYSLSSPLVDEQGQLLPPSECPFLEFYVVLIREAEDHAPALTPRLFSLEPGDRLFVGPKVTGHYTLHNVKPDDNCVFVSTGTGEAPNNAMVAHLLGNGHRGQLVAVTCTRYHHDLGYYEQHQLLEEQFDNYQYFILTTREQENLDPSAPNFVGKRYLQEYLKSGDFERDARLSFDPENTHVFLCGNPTMIGTPKRLKSGELEFPNGDGMIKLLLAKGFRMDLPQEEGNIHWEKYW
jgi:ferredoxin--NADP+ reductase